METQITNQQFFLGTFLLIAIAFLALAAVNQYRKRKKLQFISSFSLHFDPSELDAAAFSGCGFDDSEDIYAFSQSRMLACEATDGRQGNG